MNILIVSNIFIVIFGVSAIWLSQSTTLTARKYASLCGLMSQPFWFYVTIQSEQWGIVFVCM